MLATKMRLQELENDALNLTLHRASQLGKLNVVTYLVYNGADIEQLDEDELSPLFLAGQYPMIISILIRHGACRRSRSKRHPRKDVLHHYASLNQTEGIHSLLTHYYNINLGDDDGNTALHYATRNGHKSAVELLINKGATVDVKCGQMDTALHMAVRNGHRDILQLLHSHGADLDAKNNFLYTPLHIAAEIGGKDSIQRLPGHYNAKGWRSETDGSQMVAMLLMLGANIDAVDMIGQTPLILAVQSKNVNTVTLLMNHGAKLEAADDDGLTAVHWSAKLGNVAALDLLLHNRAQAETRTIQGDTALHIATEYNHCDAVGILLQHGANIDAKNVKGKTPMQVAIMKRHIDIAYQLKNASAAIGATEHKKIPMQSFTAAVQPNESKTATIYTVQQPDEMMVDINAALSTALRYGQFDIVSSILDDRDDIDTPNDDGLSPLFLAGQYPQLVSELLHRGACVEARNQQNRNLTVLHYYVSLGQSEAICILLNCGCNIHSTDENDNTALHYSTRKGDCEVAELLLAQGVDINAKNCRGETALHIALENEFIDLANLLIDKSIDIDAKTFKLELTALHIAIETKNSKIISTLLKQHANVNAKNILGQTPLHLAVYSELEEACDQLIEHNANVNSMDKNNCTPLHAAVERCNPVLVSLLLKNGAFINSSDYFDDPLSHAIKRFKRNTGHHLESRFTEVLTLLIKAGADTSDIQVPDTMKTRLPSLMSILAISPSKPPSQKGKSNIASTTVEDHLKQSDFSDVVLTEFKENTSSKNKRKC
jgi:ankyrin repeat protein